MPKGTWNKYLLNYKRLLTSDSESYACQTWDKIVYTLGLGIIDVYMLYTTHYLHHLTLADRCSIYLLTFLQDIQIGHFGAFLA